jgi:hypothetical protein
MKDERYLRSLTKQDLIELRDACGDPVYKKALRYAVKRIDELEVLLECIQDLIERDIAKEQNKNK